MKYLRYIVLLANIPMILFALAESLSNIDNIFDDEFWIPFTFFILFLWNFLLLIFYCNCSNDIISLFFKRKQLEQQLKIKELEENLKK